MQVSMSMRLPEEVNTDLDLLAKSMGRSKSYIAVEALKDFISREKWQIAKIEEGIEEAENNHFAKTDDIKNLDAKWGYNGD